MKVLNRIKSESIVSIDIETVRIVDKYEDLDEATAGAWEYKHKHEGIVPDFEELEAKWYSSAPLYAEFAKVCAVTVTFIHKDKLYAKEFYGPNELEILEALSSTLDGISTKGDHYRLAGHSAKFFDYPFLCKRYVVNGLDIPDIIDSTDKKPWEQMNLCTNDLWKMGGSGHGSSLTALCNLLGIPSSKVDLVGDQVGEAYYEGRYEEIGRYCSYDTVATFNVFRRFKKEDIFQFDEVIYVNGITAKPEVVKTRPLVELFKNDYFSDSVKEELTKRTAKKKLTKKDREFLQDLLENAYIRSEFMASDTPDVTEAKKSEVAEFIKTLK